MRTISVTKVVELFIMMEENIIVNIKYFLFILGPARQTSTQGNKLDKVVLNLKKTAGNQWNVDSNGSAVSPSRISGGSSSDSRRGRKSNLVPKRKIQPSNEEIGINSSQTSDSGKLQVPNSAAGYELLSLDELCKKKSGDVEPETSPTIVAANKGQKASSLESETASPVRKNGLFSSPQSLASTASPQRQSPLVVNSQSSSAASSPRVGNESERPNADLWNTKLIESDKIELPGISRLKVLHAEPNVSSPEKSPLRTFSRKDRPAFKVLSSLSNRVTMNCGINVSISIPDLAEPATEIDKKTGSSNSSSVVKSKEEGWNQISDLVRIFINIIILILTYVF
jgi:hypothetical protein